MRAELKSAKIVGNRDICGFSGENHQNNGDSRFPTPQMFQFKRALTPSLARPLEFLPSMTFL